MNTYIHLPRIDHSVEKNVEAGSPLESGERERHAPTADVPNREVPLPLRSLARAYSVVRGLDLYTEVRQETLPQAAAAVTNR